MIFQRKSLELTLDELWESALKPISEREFQLNLVWEPSKFRLVPYSVVQISKALLNENGVDKALTYLRNSFYIFRESFDKALGLAHHKVNGVYEWVTPVEFSWCDVEEVIERGDYIKKNILASDAVLIIDNIGNGLEHIREIRIDGNEVVDGKDIIREKIDLISSYKIESLKKIGFIPAVRWEKASLKAYVNPSSYILDDLSSGKLSEKKAIHHFNHNMQIIEQVYDAQVGKHKSILQKANVDIRNFWG